MKSIAGAYFEIERIVCADVKNVRTPFAFQRDRALFIERDFSALAVES